MGSLTHIEQSKHIPFEIKRIYYTYSVPHNVKRGIHAHKELEQLLISISGSIRIKVDDGNDSKFIELNSPCQGLYIPPMIWRELDHFSPGSVLLVLASQHYTETDYIHNYEEFLNTK